MLKSKICAQIVHKKADRRKNGKNMGDKQTFLMKFE